MFRARLSLSLLLAASCASPDETDARADASRAPAEAARAPANASLVPAEAAAEPTDPGQDFVVPEGLGATLWAESPQLFNPTAMDVDAQGRLWVAEAVNYRKWDGRNPGLTHPEGDRIVVLEDRDGDGRAETSTVFAQDAELVAPLGVAAIGDPADGGAVYVSCSPHLFVYRDTDGDLRADERETLLTGFGGFDHDHGLHSLVVGPDGRFTFAAGNAGPHRVFDTDARLVHEAALADFHARSVARKAARDAARLPGGSEPVLAPPPSPNYTVDAGSVYNGGGPALADNHPGLRGADGRAYTGGLILRSDADGNDLQVLAHNFRNNYEVAVDAFGNLWQSDNDDDGNASCRTLWCMEGGDHGYFSADGTRYWSADRRPGQPTPRAHWHQDDPGVVPMGTINGGGGPTGVAMYEGALLAPWIDGAVLNADAGAGVVYAHRPRAKGAGYELEMQDLIRAAPGVDGDRSSWFRPSDVVVGVDGSVFVADWFDPGVGGHAMGDREGYGRILRIAPLDTAARGGAVGASDGPASDAAFTTLEPLDSLEARLRALGNPAVHRREAGRAALASGSARVRAALRATWRDADDRRLRARCLWLLLGPAFADAETLDEALSDPDSELRVTALRAWAQNTGDRLAPAFVRERRLVADPSAAVRREIALRLRPDAPLDLLHVLAERLDPSDRWELEAFGLAAETHGEALISAWLPVGRAREWDARFTALAWRLHPASLVPSWRERALDSALPADARLQSLDALAFTPGRDAPEAMLDLVLQLPKGAVQERASWWLRHRDGNDWRADDLLSALGSDELADAQLLHDSGLIRAGLHEIDVELSGATTLWLEVADAGNGNSCDWANWIAPSVELADGSGLLLSEQPWVSAEAAWGSVRRNSNCVGGPLQVGETVYAEGLGTHAASLIRFELPEGARRFSARVGPDVQGTSQGNGEATSVRFRVHAATEHDAAWYAERLALIAPLDEAALDVLSDADEARREATALELATDPQGALLLLELAAEDALATELREPIGEALFLHADLSVRALASEHFTRPGEHAQRFPPIAELLALEGDPNRGREVFLDEAASGCLRCHAYTLGGRSRGGKIGPELTLLHEKLDAATILDSILNPSAGITVGYESWLVKRNDGQLLNGFVRADGATLVLDDTLGVRHVIPREEIASRRPQKLSVMPDGVATALDPQQLMDLVAFLDEPVSAPAVRGEARALFDGETLAGWTVIGERESWSVNDGVLRTNGQPAGYLRTKAEFTSFELQLEWRFDPGVPGNSGVLLRLHGENKVWPRSIEAQLQAGNAGDFWNIGEFGMATDIERLDGRHTRKLEPSAERPLGEWNHYRIVVAGAFVELWVNGVLMNTASWAEETPGHIALQSEGVPVEFRNIRLTPLER